MNVISLAKEEGIEVLEKRITLEDLESYQECFVTGTAAEVTPVNQIGKFNFNPGLLCKKFIEKYSLLTTKN